ncbi:MAG: NAD(P)/FAD-dependent oxidoreductase, partial [Candidatus Bathyarchaeia archaeon]
MAPQPTLAVVGAGPTGSFAATRATERGARVQVYEEHPTVGEPSHCVGHLSLQGLGRLSLTPPPKVIQKRVTRYRFYSPSGVGLTLEPPEPRTVIVNRALFDHWLSLEAERKGSFIQRGCRVESIHMDGGGKVVLRIRRGRDIRMESVDLLIDSEGYPPALLIKGGLVHPFSSRHVIGILVECEGV